MKTAALLIEDRVFCSLFSSPSLTFGRNLLSKTKNVNAQGLGLGGERGMGTAGMD